MPLLGDTLPSFLPPPRPILRVAYVVGHRDQDRPEKSSPLLLEREEGEEEKGGATASTDSVSPVSLGGEKKEKEEVELESGRVYEARRERERERE